MLLILKFLKQRKWLLFNYLPYIDDAFTICIDTSIVAKIIGYTCAATWTTSVYSAITAYWRGGGRSWTTKNVGDSVIDIA